MQDLNSTIKILVSKLKKYAAETIFALQASQSYIKQGNFVLNEIKGKIEFDNLGFGYIPDKPVFKNFNLVIQPGEKVAIVGHTGAGYYARLYNKYFRHHSYEFMASIKESLTSPKQSSNNTQ
ncbi:hypothetical protein LCGC14_0767300 [marine sediment metagenome]|uniref:ABC transporter domain-containing protein n=1 Tax=marine sediment metagenome TaxID=412755 RepID=A0A0F9SJD3_9ZZZZ|nr:hypothetical protein [bacterium]